MTLNTNDLTIGGAEIYFHDTTASPAMASMPSPISLGNIVTSGITPEITTVEHFIRVKGEKKKDKEFNIVNSMAINFSFDEINTTNVQRLLLGGSVDATASRMPVGIKRGVEGRAVLRLVTDVGKNIMYVIPKCNLKPDGALNLTSKDWIKGTFKLSVLHHPTYHVGDSAIASLAPFGYIDTNSTNVSSPFWQ